MLASEIAKALDVRRVGGTWMARCPAHDDHDPSLAITNSRDGKVLLHCHAGCTQTQVLDALRGLGLWPEVGRNQSDIKGPRTKPAAKPKHQTPCGEPGTPLPPCIWRESVDPRGTFAENYLRSRGLILPADPEILLRSLHFHPRCPWGGARVPALIAAFTPIQAEVPADPFLDPWPVAIHRIRGRGHDNKRMLGPVKGCAVMISPWWHVWEQEHLHVCEGVETALGLYNEGSVDPEDCRRPVWALGSAGAIRALPIINRVRRLVIWADHDPSGTGIEAAMEAARRWQAAGKQAVVRYRNRPGADYADDK